MDLYPPAIALDLLAIAALAHAASRFLRADHVQVLEGGQLRLGQGLQSYEDRSLAATNC